MTEQTVEDPTSNYRGYAVSEHTGVVHVDPVTNKLHRKDHICNQQCRDLAARAKEEYRRDIGQMSGREVAKAANSSDDIWKEPKNAPKGGSGVSKKGADIVVLGGWVGPPNDVLDEWEQNRKDLEGYASDDEEDMFVPSNDAQARLITAMADELMQRSVNLTPASCVGLAGYLVARAVKEGWVRDA